MPSSQTALPVVAALARRGHDAGALSVPDPDCLPMLEPLRA